MSAWPGKYVIGLTGNIATGKSIVRKMLEDLGACGIDADALSNQAFAKGSPGYQPVVDIFGRWFLTSEQEIDRAKLGRLVFSEPEALQKLEQIVHPLVLEAVDNMVSRSNHLVFVIEAIKLLESGLAAHCDSIWVTSSPPELQLERLMKKRGMSEPQALQRMNAQTAQHEKIACADVLIKNHRSLQDTWDQVVTEWRSRSADIPVGVVSVECIPEPTGEAALQRARPKDAAAIAGFFNRLSNNHSEFLPGEIVAASGEKAYLLLRAEGHNLGLVRCKLDNLVASIENVYEDDNLSFTDAWRDLLDAVEKVSKELQCEISLILLPDKRG